MVLEEKAAEATSLPAFPVNLKDVRRVVREMTSLFNSSTIFKEYTIHDYRHVEDMLKIASWVITDDGLKVITDAEAILIVLSIYLHDVGLIVTDAEYSRRAKTDYIAYARENLYVGDSGKDYSAKLQQLSEEERDKFLYQEFVRAHHGARVKSWIEGKPNKSLGFDENLVDILGEIFTRLPEKVRRDLGVICESHLHDDLDDETKYRLAQPYGNSERETANLRYVAVILRTADLLNITQSRAPTITYRILNPTDPVSQAEWAKQNAVTRVKAKPGTNQDGDVDPAAATSTIEIFASFKDDRGFFGLTTYLRYALSQIRMSYDLILKSNKKTVIKYKFPWRNIDESNIEAEGFLAEQFGFEIDQHRILDLLTGHTLYNDSAVVLRELAQNSIDAVRLQSSISKVDPRKAGRIDIKWDTAVRALSITDNGTGMSKAVIVDHLLKVGSSRYQDVKFKEKFPDFSAISRFGIGVLSAFMVADEVEILTCSPDEEHAIQISLRSVHGKYLVRLHEKENVPEIYPHGTSITLKLRPSALDVDLSATLAKWIMFPNCKVFASVDNEAPVQIGYDNPQEAVERFLKSDALSAYQQQGAKAIYRERNGLQLAVALRYDSMYRDWQFVYAPSGTAEQRGSLVSPISTSIGGIAVDFSTPGFNGQSFIAIANATGKAAPRTNVARSGLERTPEKAQLEVDIYTMYVEIISEEIARLRDSEKYTLTWSVEQLPYLSSALMGYRYSPVNRVALEQAKAQLEWFLIEDKNGRRSASLTDLVTAGTFTTIDSQMVRSIEMLVRESRKEVSTRELIPIVQDGDLYIDNEIVVTNLNAGRIEAAAEHFVISGIAVRKSERTLRLKWGLKAAPTEWLREDDLGGSLFRRDMTEYRRWRSIRDGFRVAGASGRTLAVPVRGVSAEGCEGIGLLLAGGLAVVVPETSLQKFFLKFIDQISVADHLECLVYMKAMSDTVTGYLPLSGQKRSIESVVKSVKEKVGITLSHLDEFYAAYEEMSGLEIFDPYALSQRDAEF